MENQPAQPTTSPTPQPSPPETPPISKVKKISKALIIVLVLLFLATTGIAGYFTYQNYQSKKQTSQLQPSLFPIATTSPITTPTASNSASTPDPTADWKTYTNEIFGFEFKYPEKNRYEPQRELGDTSPIFCYLLDEKATPKSIEGTACIWTGFISQDQLNIMGISYCGAYPKDSRCQSLKTNEGAFFIIDWGIEVPDTNEKKASAWISPPQGGIVTVELQPVEPKSKELFIQILSTFKFADKTKKIVDKSFWNYCDENNPCFWYIQQQGDPMGQTFCAPLKHIKSCGDKCMEYTEEMIKNHPSNYKCFCNSNNRCQESR